MKWCRERSQKTSRCQSYARWTSQKKYFRLKGHTRPLRPNLFQAPPHHRLMPLPRSSSTLRQSSQRSMHHLSVVNRVLSEKVYLLVEELLALAPEVRRHFKECTTTKKLPAPPAEAQATAAHTVSTFSMGMEHE